MKVQHYERGRFKGQVDLTGSIQTMSVVETWKLDPETTNLRTVRNVCSLASKLTDKVFTAQCPGLTENYIKITRLR